MQTIQRMLNKKSLDIVGSFNPDRSDNVCSKLRTILLVGPKEPFFWDVFKKSSEYRDNKENPLDRWSKKNDRRNCNKIECEIIFSFRDALSAIY